MTFTCTSREHEREDRPTFPDWYGLLNHWADAHHMPIGAAAQIAKENHSANV